MANGARGGKLLGAGNGGFLMFFAPPDLHARISRTLPDLKPVKFRFDRTGSQIVFYQPADSAVSTDFSVANYLAAHARLADKLDVGAFQAGCRGREGGVRVGQADHHLRQRRQRLRGVALHHRLEQDGESGDRQKVSRHLPLRQHRHRHRVRQRHRLRRGVRRVSSRRSSSRTIWSLPSAAAATPERRQGDRVCERRRSETLAVVGYDGGSSSRSPSTASGCRRSTCSSAKTCT